MDNRAINNHHKYGNNSFIVIADDFTGANDIGVQFANAGYHVDVWLNSEPKGTQLENRSVSVFCTNSRDLPAHQASKKLSAIGRLINENVPLVKKIDSTLRGNVGAEIEALLQGSERQLAIVAPAAPSIGRTTRKGACYVYDNPLLDTEFASDPKSPIYSSDIKLIISNQTELPVAKLTREQLHDDTVAAHLDDLVSQGCRIVVVDAHTINDLQKVVAISEQITSSAILVGASDLGLAIAGPKTNICPDFSQILAVIGSMSEVSQQQIDQVKTHNMALVLPIDIEQLLGDGKEHLINVVSNQTIEALSKGKNVIIHTISDSRQRKEIEALAAKYQLTRSGIGDSVKSALAQITRRIIPLNQTAALYLSGGDVAMAAAQELGAKGFSLKGQVAGCVPWGSFSNGIASERIVLTKAGAFGDSRTLHQILQMIEDNKSE